MVPGLNRVAAGLEGASKAAVSAGLFQWRVGLGHEPESNQLDQAVRCPCVEAVLVAVQRIVQYS